MAKLTEKEIAGLKEKHGDIYKVEIGDLVAYFAPPDIKTWRYAMKALDKGSAVFKKALINNMFKAGDKGILGDDYYEDIGIAIADLVEYPDAEYEREGNAYRVTVEGKTCLLRPITVEMQSLAERDNARKIPFATEENLLARMWLEGDEELKGTKNVRYFIPISKILQDLRTKFLVQLKKM